MKIRTRIFLGIFLVVGVGLAFVINWVSDDLTPQYRESTEEPLVDTARILAAIAAANSTQGQVHIGLFRSAFREVASRPFSAEIYGLTKTKVDFRAYITNVRGTVLFDSDDGRDEGKDYSQWRDVYLTLRGQYGARSTRHLPEDDTSSVLYVAAPIVAHGETIGVLSVGKPTSNINVFIERAKEKIYIGGLVSGGVILAVGLFVSAMVTRPIRKLTAYAKAIRDGKPATFPHLGTSEVGELGAAFEEMREALEGKHYVEKYVQTLTHEIKSPLAAIQGAAELLKENMSAERRERFVENISVEARRITTIIEKLLLLSSLENRKGLQEVVRVNLWGIVQETCKSLEPLIERKNIRCEVTGDANASFSGESLLVRQAVVNLLQNALDFAPREGTIQVNVRKTDGGVELLVKDNGPGIPAYAAERVFERFYSLQRPDTEKKSSGLGLSIVKEITALHHGVITVQNAPGGGVEARVYFAERQ